MRYPLTTVPCSVYPDGDDWGGPDNRHDTDFRAYNIELSHSFGERLRLPVAHDGQVDDTTRLQTYSSAGALGIYSRAVFIDVNRVQFGRFFPLVRPYLAAAREAARAQGLDPDDDTAITQQVIDDTEGAVRAVRRETANLTARYSFTEGNLRGFAIGASARYAMGRPRAALSSGGVVVLPATRTDDYFLLNPFASYRRKIYNRNVTAQLNVNNVLGLNSDQGNSYTWPRKTEPRQYVTTATVEF